MGLLRKLSRRLAVMWHAPRHWRFRRGTIDRRIFRDVVIHDEYALPALGQDDLIVDIGAHTGSFALAAMRRGAGRVVCCEPSPDNFSLLRHNLGPFGDRVTLLQCAVWRSDVPAGRLRLCNPVDERNTGAVQAWADGDGVEVEAVPFDDLLAGLTAAGRRVRLLKLDCEGAEWPILFTTRRLAAVDEMCGEYHLPPLAGPWEGLPIPSVRALMDVLGANGFRTEAEPCPRSPLPVGRFRAWRRA
jgi:FkbM family methyltransferase